MRHPPRGGARGGSSSAPTSGRTLTLLLLLLLAYLALTAPRSGLIDRRAARRAALPPPSLAAPASSCDAASSSGAARPALSAFGVQPLRPRAGLDRCGVRTYQPPYLRLERERNTTWPFLSEDGLRGLADWVIDPPEYGCRFAPAEVRCGDVVFVKTDFLEDFLTGASLDIAAPFVLITGASDSPVPSEPARAWLAAAAAAPALVGRAAGAASGLPLVVRWFAQNLYNDHPPHLEPSPLGLNGAGWYAGEDWPPFGSHFRLPAQVAAELRRKIVAFLASPAALLDSADSGPGPGPGPGFAGVGVAEGVVGSGDEARTERQRAREAAVVASFQVITSKAEREAALVGAERLGLKLMTIPAARWPAVLRGALFVFSPRGNGADTHRLWEVLLSGSIPLVRAGLYEQLLACLPFASVLRWEELEWRFIVAEARDALARLDAGAFDFRRVFFDYYAERVLGAADEARARCAAGSRTGAA